MTNIITDSNTPSESTVLGIKKTIITDAQIKALPTTRVELLPPPGVGKMIVPISIFGVWDSTAGAYSDGANEASFAVGYTANGGTFSRVRANFVNSATKSIVSFWGPITEPGVGEFAGEKQVNSGFDVPENQGFNIGDDWYAPYVYTGGHPDNTFTIIIYYTIFNL